MSKTDADSKMAEGKIHRSRLNPVRFVSRFILKILGWKICSIPLKDPKFVMIGVPHTSNWDFILGFMVMSATGLKLHWVGKHTLFKGPLGWFMRWTGGIPVNRNISSNFVNQLIETFNRHEKLIVVLAPEGTRRRTDYWKSGFYYIALGAQVPVVLGFLDYSRRVGGYEKMMYPSGQQSVDLMVFRKYYRKEFAKYPEKFSEIRFRSD